MYNNNGPKKNFDTGGVLFPTREKKGPTSPDFRGNVRINRELLDYLIDEMESGRDLILTLFGYNRQGKEGRFIGLSPAIPMEPNEGNQRGFSNQNNQQQGRSYQRPQQNNFQPQRNNYREQSGGSQGYGGPRQEVSQGGRTDYRPQRQPAEQRMAEEQRAVRDFQQGDRMPDFGERSPEKLPWDE